MWGKGAGLAILLVLGACGGVSTSTPAQAGGASSGGQAGSGAEAQASGGDGGAPHRPFLCGGGAYVPASELCDGKPDCPGGNDEWECPRYFCANGEDLAGFRVCDGTPDCLGGEDEHDDQCATVDTEFHCSATVRVPRRDVCDGKTDCASGADEAICPDFLCHDGAAAITESAACNGITDCADGSDELNCEVP